LASLGIEVLGPIGTWVGLLATCSWTIAQA